MWSYASSSPPLIRRHVVDRDDSATFFSNKKTWLETRVYISGSLLSLPSSSHILKARLLIHIHLSLLHTLIVRHAWKSVSYHLLNYQLRITVTFCHMVWLWMVNVRWIAGSTLLCWRPAFRCSRHEILTT